MTIAPSSSTIQFLRLVSNWRRAAQFLLVVFVGGAIGAQYFSYPPGPPNNQGVSLTADRVVASRDGTRIDVVLRVTSGQQDLGPISVFWMIGLPGGERPWEAPRYVAPAHILSGLPSAATTEEQWIGTPLNVPPGRYEVTGWVHKILGAGQTEHLAGGSVGSFEVTRPVPTSLHLTEESFNQPVGPLVLESLSLDQDVQDQLVSVELTVRNRGSLPVAGRSQLVVSRFTDPEPFRTAFWQTTWLDVPMLEPGDPYTLSWKQPISLPAGTYGLSAWLHARLNGTWEHSHGSFNIPLQLGPNISHVQRAGPAVGTLHIRQATAETGHLDLVVENEGPARSVSASIALVSQRRRFDWSITALDAHESVSSFELDQGSVRVIQLPVQIDCVADNRLAHVTLFSATSAGSDERADDLLVDACA